MSQTIQPLSPDHPLCARTLPMTRATLMEEEDLLGEYLVGYGASPEHPGMDVNVIMFSTDCTIIGDDEPIIAQFDFGPKEAIFTKPKESVNHLKPLFIHGHIDGIPIAKMLVDGGATVNLMPYTFTENLESKMTN
jgi:hypothetical protein